MIATEAAPICPPHPCCPLCGGAGGAPAFPYETRWNGRTFGYVACRGCGCSFIDPLPTAAEFDAMYDRGAYHDVHYAAAGETDELRASFRFLAGHAASGCLLDFGAGNGAFLLAASARGYAAQGIEQGESSIALAREISGANVATLDAVEASGDRFDIIHLADVLEHLPRPADMLRRLERLLAPDGIFFLEGPIEKQRSLVHGFASTLKAARRRVGTDRPGDFTPYHLTLTDWRAQAHFFEHVLGYALAARVLYETAWPYPARVERTASSGSNARALVGRAAVALDSVGVGRLLGLANRFRVIARPPHLPK